MYQQLTQDKRYTLMSLMKAGYKQKEICRVLNCHRSTIYRELKRNTLGFRYSALTAEKESKARRANNRPLGRLTSEIKSTIKYYLNLKWSPEQIVGYCRKQGIDMVSHETIYLYLYRLAKKGGILHKNLRRKVRFRRNRSLIRPRRRLQENKPMIETRPEEVELKERIGDWEGDLIVGAHQTGNLVTLVDRHTKFTLIGFAKSKKSKVVTREIARLFRQVPKEWRKTLTLDNGPEFSQYKNIRKRCSIDVFYANPYCSWERGLNENTNGLIRQYFPKRSSFKKITKEDILEVQLALNSRPRKILNFNSPLDMFPKLQNVALES